MKCWKWVMMRTLLLVGFFIVFPWCQNRLWLKCDFFIDNWCPWSHISAFGRDWLAWVIHDTSSLVVIHGFDHNYMLGIIASLCYLLVTMIGSDLWPCSVILIFSFIWWWVLQWLHGISTLINFACLSYWHFSWHI